MNDKNKIKNQDNKAQNYNNEPQNHENRSGIYLQDYEHCGNRKKLCFFCNYCWT